MSQTTYSATEFRENLFDILNRVYYGGETIHIKKNDKVVASIIKPTKTEEKEDRLYDLKKLAGTLSEESANTIRDAVRKSKKLPPRAHDPFSY